MMNFEKQSYIDKLKKKLKLSSIIDLDPELKEFLQIINSNEHIVTISSCSGHFRKCKAYNPLMIIMDDNFYEELDNSYYCTSSNQPFIEFKCTEKLFPFVKSLSQVPESLASFNIFGTSIFFAYGNGDEGFIPQIRDIYEPRFKQFWQFFADCWKNNVDQFSELPIPSKYSLNLECYQCEKSLSNNSFSKLLELEKKYLASYLKTELFSEHDSYNINFENEYNKEEDFFE